MSSNPQIKRQRTNSTLPGQHSASLVPQAGNLDKIEAFSLNRRPPQPPQDETAMDESDGDFDEAQGELQKTLQTAQKNYGIQAWGAPYFDVNQNGHITVEPTGRGGEMPKIDLYNLVEDCVRRGHYPPLLIRFSNIVDDKIKSLNQAFERAIIANQYDNTYQQVFPLRVCPSRSVIEEVVKNPEVGLCASSKPELLIVLAMLRTRGTVIVCTGYKDTEYIETALLAQQLGQIPIIIIEKLLELDLVLKASQKLGLKPIIGVRTKIVSVPLQNGADITPKGHRYLGFSVDVGDKAKYGLSATEIMHVVQRLKDAQLLDCLQMLTFHIGSQISNIHSIRQATREASQFYVQLCRLGCNMKYLDVGGGLAIDYDGSRTNTHMSLNYTVDEYASEVVSTVKESCQKNQIFNVPVIISQSGRHVTAHHCVVVFNVTDATTVSPLKPNQVDNLFSTSPDVPAPEEKDHELCHKLYELLHTVTTSSLQETIHDAKQYKDEALALFTLGVESMDLDQRSKVETYFWCVVHDVAECLNNMKFIPEELEDLRGLLSYTYYCNFSLFQSAPDSWARNFVFPVVPIHRLGEKPSVNASLADLTCDSDGKVSCFARSEQRDGSTKELLDLHALKPQTPYYIGMFLTGAYQEILGSMHNLYGDTHILVIQSDPDTALGYNIKHTIPGNTIDDVLRGFQYEPSGMLENIRLQSEKALRSKDMTLPQYRTLVAHYEKSLRNYTYLTSASADGLDYEEMDLMAELDGVNPNATVRKQKQSDISRYLFNRSTDQPPQPKPQAIIDTNSVNVDSNPIAPQAAEDKKVE